jgi:serine/threonine-protein kinase RsbW
MNKDKSTTKVEITSFLESVEDALRVADEIEDIKVVISEICTFFIKNLEKNTDDLEIAYQAADDKIIVTVTDLNEGRIFEEQLNNDMSIMIIESLSDNFNYDLNNKSITFEKIK